MVEPHFKQLLIQELRVAILIIVNIAGYLLILGVWIIQCLNPILDNYYIVHEHIKFNSLYLVTVDVLFCVLRDRQHMHESLGQTGTRS